MASPININANLKLNPSSINASAKQVQQALGRITGSASEFQKSLDASTARVFAFGATTAVINGVTQSFKALVSTTITVQSKLVEINSILGAGAQEFNKYRNAIFDVAKTTGQSFQTVADGAAELARQGLSATESAKRLEAALILTRISGLGSAQSVKALTAAMNGFTSAGLSAEQVVNKIVAVDTAFAVSAQDLADGFSRAGSTAEDAGVSFDQLLGLITAVEQRTARGGAVIGNAFKSIFTRLSRGSTIEDLKSLGVQIDATQTGVQKLQALSKALENISDPTVASQIKELAGGVFQINVVSAALKDIGSESSVFGKATAKSFDATNEATSKNIALNEQLSAQINSLVVSVTSLGAKIGNLTFAPLLKNLLGIATVLSEGLDSALDPEKGNKFVQGLFKTIGAFIGGPGLIMITVAFAKIFKTVLKFAGEGFRTVMQMGSATEKIKNIEGGIVGLLQKDAALRKTLSSTTATQAQKEKAVIAAIQRENALLTQQQTLVRNIAAMSAQRGVTGYSSSGGFKGKKGKRFSSGGGGIMEPDLETAMVNEARDAPRGASPFVTNFRGNPAVMNTSETQVRIGGREEILTAEQADALIPRFNKGSKKKGRKITTGSFAYLVPKVGVKKTFGPMHHDGRNYDGKTPIRGPRPEAIEGVSDDTEANLEGTLTKNIINGAAKWTQKLAPLGRRAKYDSIRRGFDTIAGAKGGLKAAIGGAFEVAINRSLDYEAATREIGGDFDVRGGKNLHRVQDLFGIKQRIADFKVSDSSGNKKSFLDKIRKEKGYPEGGGERKKDTTVVTKKELDRAAEKKARLNVKNRYGNAEKFRQGSTIPLRQYKAEMEEAIRQETARIKRDISYNAATDFTNKDDRAERRRRGQKVGPMFTRRVGRRAKGSLSASKFNSLKRYSAGSMLMSLIGKGLGKGRNLVGKGMGGVSGGQVGNAATMTGLQVGQTKFFEGKAEDEANRKLNEAKEALNKNPNNPELQKNLKFAEDQLKSTIEQQASMGDYLTMAGMSAGFSAAPAVLRAGYKGTKNVVGGGLNKAKNYMPNRNTLKKTRIPAALTKKTGPYNMPKGYSERLKAQKTNAGIDRARSRVSNVGKKVGLGGASLAGAAGLQMLKDPVADSMKTSGGQDTAGSIITRGLADAGSYGLSAPGPAKVPAAIFGFGKSMIDQFEEALNEQEFQESEGLRLDDFHGALKDRQSLEARFGLTGGKLSGINHQGTGFSMAAREAGTDGPKNLNVDRTGRSLKELQELYGGNANQLGDFIGSLKQARITYADTASEFTRSSRQFSEAEGDYESLLYIRDHLMISADAMGYYRKSIVEFTKELEGLAKGGGINDIIKRGEAKAQQTKDTGDFLGAMTGPGKEDARLSNKVRGVMTGLLNEENKIGLLGVQSAGLQKLPADSLEKRNFMDANEIATPALQRIDDGTEQGRLETENEANNRAIAAHFKKQVEDAGKVFNANVREGAKSLIMERIAITERIKQLKGNRRELTGGIDPDTGKPVQGSINSKSVSEIVSGAKQGPINAGRVREIVNGLGEARDSGDIDKFQMMMTNLEEELQGRLSGNEDKVLKHFGFSLDERTEQGQKNKAFFDKVTEDSVAIEGDTGLARGGDTGFIRSLDGSGKDREKIGDIDKEIGDNEKRRKYLDDQIGKLGDQFGKEVVDQLQRSAEEARRMADGLNEAGQATSGLVDVAVEISALRTASKEIIEADKARIKEISGQMTFMKGRIGDIEGRLGQLMGGSTTYAPTDTPAPTPAPAEGSG